MQAKSLHRLAAFLAELRILVVQRLAGTAANHNHLFRCLRRSAEMNVRFVNGVFDHSARHARIRLDVFACFFWIEKHAGAGKTIRTTPSKRRR